MVQGFRVQDRGYFVATNANYSLEFSLYVASIVIYLLPLH